MKSSMPKIVSMVSVSALIMSSTQIGVLASVNIPKEEVCNLIYWRQLDAARNSIQMVGQANFSHKELQNKSCNDIQDMLMTRKGINWNNFPTYQKRGSCCIKEDYADKENGSLRTHWIIDKESPMFKGEDRDYVDKLIYVGE